MNTTAWRVVCEDGSVHCPVVAEAKGDPRSFFALSNEPDDDHSGWGEMEQLAVIDLARKMSWPVVEIVAPGAMTSDERVAEATRRHGEAVRDACADALDRRVIRDDMTLAMARSAIHDLDIEAIRVSLP